MGIFGRRIDIKNATKTTYSDEDLRKLDLNYRNEFQIDREKRIYTPFRKEMPRAWQSQVRDMAFEKILDFAPTQAVIVGDSLTSDIRGGINAGVRTIWFNPKGQPPVPGIVADYELQKLKDLPELLQKL